LCAADDAGRRVHARGHRGEDGVAGGVLGVDDAPRAVPALAGQVQGAGAVAVEAHRQFVEQQFLDRPRPFAHEVLDRGRVGRPVARRHDVARQRGGIGRRVVDDAALRPVAVGRERFGEREQLDVEAERRRPQRVGGPGEAGADHETVGAVGAHAVRVRASRAIPRR
jgi:hypothetical protein